MPSTKDVLDALIASWVGTNYLPEPLRKIREFKAIPVIKRNERNTKDGVTATQDSLGRLQGAAPRNYRWRKKL
ncbi:MAG: hypothetical protein HY930_01065 [Euryarchaeota archaeon]|nr:hypothetical protein [Euryarchaeota archaeon]